MKQRKIKKQLVLMTVMCLLVQGCAGRDRDSHDQWSFQASQTETAEKSFNAGQHEGEGSMTVGNTDDTGSGVSAADADDTGVSATAVDADDTGASATAVDADNTGASVPAGDTEDGNASVGYVYVCGAVKHPGVYEIHEGMRIFEVLQLAGGMTEEADPDWMNLAQQITDGQKLQIYTKEETELMRSSGMADGSMTGLSGGTGAEDSENSQSGLEGQARDKVNINTADREELMTLPGIGEAKAEAILKYRQEHGAFGAIEEICRISGIKEAVFSNIKDRITV